MNQMEKEIRSKLDRVAEDHTKSRLANIEMMLPAQSPVVLKSRSRRLVAPGVVATSAAGVLIVSIVVFANNQGILRRVAESDSTSHAPASSAPASVTASIQPPQHFGANATLPQESNAGSSPSARKSPISQAPSNVQPKGTAAANAGTLAWSVPNFVAYANRIYFLRYETAYGVGAATKVTDSAACGEKLGSFVFNGTNLHTVSGQQNGITVSVFSVKGESADQSICITSPLCDNENNSTLFPQYTKLRFLLNDTFAANGIQYRITGNIWSVSGSASGTDNDNGYEIDWYPGGADEGYPAADKLGATEGGTLYRIKGIDPKNAVYLNASGMWFMIRCETYVMPKVSSQTVASITER